MKDSMGIIVSVRVQGEEGKEGTEKETKRRVKRHQSRKRPAKKDCETHPVVHRKNRMEMTGFTIFV
jgi:hypothetical protein